MTRRSDDLAQALGLGVAAAFLWWISHNTVSSLEARGISFGFGFLGQPANFAIGDAPIAYGPENSFARAILVGLANTARVSLLGWILAIVCGFALGIMRLATNPPLRALARVIVEAIRNTPLLLLLLFLAAVAHSLPSVRDALEPLPGVFLSDRGLVLPFPTLDFPPTWEVPRLRGFNFEGGITLSPEFAALLAALVLHQATHVSEAVRGAILAVPRGQRDAAAALGLTRGQALRFVVVPQALRAMVPLLANNCVSLTKNSSLAVAIGFPDVVSVLNTTANQTGHAVESMLIMIVVYLVLSLSVASLMNRYNASIVRRGLRPA
jgi:general L-amino acid transport system permease protein